MTRVVVVAVVCFAQLALLACAIPILPAAQHHATEHASSSHHPTQHHAQQQHHVQFTEPRFVEHIDSEFMTTEPMPAHRLKVSHHQPAGADHPRFASVRHHLSEYSGGVYQSTVPADYQGSASSSSSSSSGSSSSDFDPNDMSNVCWKWKAPKAPGSVTDPREGVIAFSNKNSIYLYGGCGKGNHIPNCGILLEVFDTVTRTWSEKTISVTEPSFLASVGAAYTVNSSSNVLYEFGGSRQVTVDSNSITDWLASLKEDQGSGVWEWKRINAQPVAPGQAPPALQDASLTSVGNTLVLFGGYNTDGFSNKLFVTTPGDWKWSIPLISGTAPSARSGHSATRFGDKIYFFGGQNGHTLFNDLQALTVPGDVNDIFKWELITPTRADLAPSARAFHSMFVLSNSRFLLHGGVNPTQGVVYNDLFILDVSGPTWVKMPPSLADGATAESRKLFAGALSPNRTELFVFGGCAHHKCHDIFTPGVLDMQAVCKNSCKHGSYDGTLSECGCEKDWGGKFCDQQSSCPKNCTGRGECLGGKCKCRLGWGGEACTQAVCPNNCNGLAGQCSDGQKRCVCSAGRWGLDCSEVNCPMNCFGRGICQNRDAGNSSSSNYCQCLKGFSGDGCQYWGRTAGGVALGNGASTQSQAGSSAQPRFTTHKAHARVEPIVQLNSSNNTAADANKGQEVVKTDTNKPYVADFSCPNHCSGHGICKRVVTEQGTVEGRCECIDGFGGVDCAGECTMHCTSPLQGKCVGADSLTVACQCTEGYKGVACSDTYCARNCSGHGSCSGDRCLCESPWSGAACQLDTSCSGNGEFIGGKCVCKAGKGGFLCDKDVTCSQDCGKNGICVGVEQTEEDALNKVPVVGYCKCNAGFTGGRCDEIECPNKCNAQGRCFPDGKCQCYSGFAGLDCGRVLQCPNNCTQSHGFCRTDPENEKSDIGVCECKDTWSGADCSLLGCPSACNHRGRCIEAKCMCDEGFTGNACEIECPGKCNKQGVCVEGKCKCYPGWDGDDCTKARACPGTGTKEGECTGHGVCHQPTGKCFCAPGFDGPDCAKVYECGQQGCSAHGVCQNSRCYCDPGFEGDHCERSTSCENDCFGRGLCANGRCFCNTGFAGASCEKKVQDNTCPKNCSSNGVCQYGRCFCVDGFQGDDCSKPVLLDQCRRFPESKQLCEGRGLCRFGQCHCAPGNAGKFCEADESCTGGCVKDQGVCLMGECHCLPGFKGPDCSEDEVCEGTPLPCTGHGICMQGQCACLPGYKGTACEVTSVENIETACPNNCTDGGVCHLGRCFCVEGRDGPDCSIKTQDACPSACNHKGLCRFGQCFCKPGYAGRACERELTCSSKCLLNGVCAYGHCFCVPGWEGKDCDVASDEKDRVKLLEMDVADAQRVSETNRPKNSTSYCEGGCGRGVCVMGKCYCEAGFFGTQCQQIYAGPLVSRCAGNCTNRGQCLFGKCFCQGGYGGQYCEKPMPLSCPYNCNGQGTCHMGMCYCNPGFEGRACEKPSSCDPDCIKSQKGVCVSGVCQCVDGYYGPTCNQTNVYQKLQFRELRSDVVSEAHPVAASSSGDCPVSCGLNGVCVNSQCYCKSGWGGADCSVNEAGLVHASRASLMDALDEGADSSSGMSYTVLSLLSFTAGIVSCVIAQIAWDKHKEMRRKRAAKDILKPLLHTLEQ